MAGESVTNVLEGLLTTEGKAWRVGNAGAKPLQGSRDADGTPAAGEKKAQKKTQNATEHT